MNQAALDISNTIPITTTHGFPERAVTRRRFSFLCHEFPPLGGGASSALDALSRSLARRGHAVQVVTIARGRDGGRTESHQRNIVRLAAGRTTVMSPSTWQLMRSYTALRNDATDHIESFGPDILVAFFAFPAGRAALSVRRRINVPLVSFLRGSDVPGFSRARWGALRGVQRTLVRPVWNHSDLLFANGQSLVKLAQDFMPSKTVANIPNGVDTDMFFPSDRQKGDGPLKILFVGQLIERKRCDVLLRAVDWLGRSGQSADVTIAGDGPLREDLMAISRQLPGNIRIHMNGLVDRRAMPSLYRNHDVLVHLSRAEGVSNVLLEAMASGLSILATRSAADEIWKQHSECGIFVKTPVPEMIGQLLKGLANDPIRRRRMQTAATAALQRNWDTAARHFEQQIATTLDTDRPSRVVTPSERRRAA